MGDAPPTGRGSGPDTEPGDLDLRRRALETGLHDARRRREPVPDSTVRSRALGMAFRIATELIAGLLVGGGIGWLLDAWLGTRPLLFLLFLALGAVAGTRNVFRYAYRMNRMAQGLDDEGEQKPDRPERP
jgi:ATP synthase protein I